MNELRVSIWLESVPDDQVIQHLPSAISVHELLQLDGDKFPLLSTIDEFSPSIFGSDDMPQLMAELRKLQTAESSATIEKIIALCELCKLCKSDEQKCITFSCLGTLHV